MISQNFWNKYEFQVDEALLFKAGYAEIFVKHIANGWLIKTQEVTLPQADLQVEETGRVEEDSDVFHFQTGKSHSLHVVPAFPNKAVVFRNNKNIKVSAGQSACLYFSIPLFLQFYVSEVKEENLLLEVPLQRLSDTWFGPADSGEPAFSIGSSYAKTLAEVRPVAWEAVVPVEIINTSTGLLDLQRLILRVEDFSLYQKNRQLLSNYVSIEFKGQENAGSVNLTTRKDIHGQKPVVVSAARNNGSKNLLRKSFFFIKNIYQS